MIAAAMVQSGAGMLAMFAPASLPITEAEALTRLPHGSTIHEAGNGFVSVSMTMEGRAAQAFADFCFPDYIPGQRLGFPRFAMRRENLGAFVSQWEAWA